MASRSAARWALCDQRAEPGLVEIHRRPESLLEPAHRPRSPHAPNPRAVAARVFRQHLQHRCGFFLRQLVHRPRPGDRPGRAAARCGCFSPIEFARGDLYLLHRRTGPRKLHRPQHQRRDARELLVLARSDPTSANHRGRIDAAECSAARRTAAQEVIGTLRALALHAVALGFVSLDERCELRLEGVLRGIDFPERSGEFLLFQLVFDG